RPSGVSAPPVGKWPTVTSLPGGRSRRPLPVRCSAGPMRPPPPALAASATPPPTPAIRPSTDIGRRRRRKGWSAVELGQQLLDARGDRIAGDPDLVELAPLGILELPVEVALAGDEGTGVATTHRHDHVGRGREVGGETLRPMVGDVDPELGH